MKHLIKIIIITVSIYQIYNLYYNHNNIIKKKIDPKSIINKKVSKTHPKTKLRKEYRKQLIGGNRININAPLNKDRESQKSKYLKRKISNNVELVLNNHRTLWEKGLTEEEFAFLDTLWIKKQNNEFFNNEDYEMIKKLEKRNILNAIKASKPQLIKSFESIEKEEEDKLDKKINLFPSNVKVDSYHDYEYEDITPDYDNPTPDDGDFDSDYNDEENEESIEESESDHTEHISNEIRNYEDENVEDSEDSIDEDESNTEEIEELVY